MAFTTAEARQQLLDTIAEAADELGFALACLGEAYELLDDTNSEALEDKLFGPVQAAYGRAKRTHTEFAGRHGLTARTFAPDATALGVDSAAGFLERAVEAVSIANNNLAELQDSMLPIEAGDEALRAGLSAVRERLDGLPEQARAFMRTLGR
jgi:hypothetical protein